MKHTDSSHESKPDALVVIQRMLNRYRDSSRVTAANLRLRLSGASNVSLTRWLFLRLLALVFLVAFVSFWVQADGLVGKEGILPVSKTLSAAQENLSTLSAAGRFLKFPTLCWFGGEWMVTVCCGVGVLAALVAMAGVAAPLCFFLMWLCYLSLCTVGLNFMNFQWDALLLESGFLAILFAPWQIKPRISMESPPSFAILLLYRWLVFRLMFASAVVKIASGDGTWFPELTSLTYHFQTQPLPTWTAWYAHHLPAGLLKGATAMVLLVELIFPFFIFMGRRLRLVACLGLVALQLLILLTGNFGFFNLLSIVLCVMLLEDTWLSDVWRAKFVNQERPGPVELRLRLTQTLALLVFIPLFSISATVLAGQVRLLGGRLGEEPELQGTSLMQQITVAAEPLRLVGTYGLFATMTTERPEIVVEGSRDGKAWTPYVCSYKPGPLDRRPRFVAPHQPRLDWQLWFAALSDMQQPQVRAWLAPFLVRLLEGSEPVLALLDHDPFEGEPPRYVRAVLYEYAFTDAAERAETGNWWKRRPLRVYCTPLSRRGR